MSRPPVPLPSIRDIFPEMSISPSQVRIPAPLYVPHPTPPQPTPPRTRDNKLPPNFLLHQPPPSPPPSSSSSESATRPQPMSPSAKQPSYSFNVLRADPITSSLEHVASSTTIRPRASSAAAHPGMHGSAPVFRVAITPGEHRPPRHRQHRPVREILPDTRERHHARDALPPSIPREADLPHLRSPSSTILSFPVSDHPVNPPSTLISTDGRRVHLRSEIPGAILQAEGRGKKHQCPHCGKRFNRPSSMKIHVNTHTGAKPYRCPFPGCGREFNVNSNMRRHWRNHSRSAPVRLSDVDIAHGGVYHPHHHPHLDGLQQHALMSPPATNSSMSEGNSDDDVYSDEEADVYPMDVDDEPRARREAEESGMCDAPVTTPLAPLGMKASAGSSSSDVSVWSRSASPARGPASTPAYGHGAQLHRHAHSPQDQQGRHPPHSHGHPAHGHGHGHGHGNGHTSEYIYRPSIAAYAISCTDSRVSTALRPAFTSNSSCTVRDRERERERERNRFHARSASGKQHGQGYPS